ncbi:class I SAM-dependent methyltransferase [Sphaerisporangium corydalis]|uniref:Methyltransferase domain-containing protein n=1 Tax=Sphaerisporangium corydalis TaxID=1441875 RepID=A0ABV9EPG2_9ACTN|nr:class I SAM-dependent methyltransferase [Sphaerisporangium corydalis]
MPNAMKSLNRKIALARRHGADRVAIALAGKALQFPLMMVFGGTRWHLRGYHTTNYKKVAVAMAGTVAAPAGVVAEVGCGLGDILTRVEARHRLGFDIDRGVIAWARFLRRFGRSRAEFAVGSFDALARSEHEAIDLLIMTGWFHYMPDDWIRDQMRSLLAVKRVRHLLVDEFPDQRGRIERLFDELALQVDRRHDWQDDKFLFLYRCGD